MKSSTTRTHLLQTRWLLPVAISLLTGSVLLQHSETPVFFARYDLSLLSIFVCSLGWALVCWWIALNPARYDRMYARLLKAKSGTLAVVIGISAVFFLDLTTGLLRDLGGVVLEHFTPLLCFGILTCAVSMVLLTAQEPYKAVQNFVVALLTMGAMVLVLEGALRWFLATPAVPRTERQFDRIVSAAWPRPIASEKPSGVFRILGLADSFGTAGGEHNYHYLLEHQLRQQSPRYELVNLSVGGYEWFEERLLFERFGPQYSPDLVLHGVFVGNDFWGDPHVMQLTFHGISVYLRQDLRSWLPHNFLVRQWVENTFVFLRNEYQRQAEVAEHPEKTIAHAEFLRIQMQRLALCLKTIRQDQPFWDQAATLLDQLHRTVRASGAEYVMLIHPDQFQVEPRVFEELQQVYQFDAQHYDLDQPQKFLRHYCQSRGIPYIDLLPVFREQGRQGGLYQPDDGHYSLKGNRLAAEVIFRMLPSQFPLLTPATDTHNADENR